MSTTHYLQCQTFKVQRQSWQLLMNAIHLSPLRWIGDSNKLPFLGMMIEKKGCELVTSVYRKPTKNGLLLHFQSHVDMHYKKALIRTMLRRAYRLSSSWELVVRECNYLKGMFVKLGYPDRLVDCHRYLVSKLSLCGERSSSEEQLHVGGKHRSGHTTFQRSEICGLRLKTAQSSWQQHRQSNTNGIHESKNWRATSNSGKKTNRR